MEVCPLFHYLRLEDDLVSLGLSLPIRKMAMIRHAWPNPGDLAK